MRRVAGPKSFALVSTAALVLAACGGPADASDPRAAFDRLRVAAAARDPQILYRVIDVDSRWALDTVWQYQRKMATLAEAMPTDARDRVLPRVAAARQAASPADFLGRQTWLGDPFARLGGGGDALGVLSSLSREGSRAVVRTTTGVAVELTLGQDGLWGWSGLRAELDRWRTITANDLSRVEADAAVMGGGHAPASQPSPATAH